MELETTTYFRNAIFQAMMSKSSFPAIPNGSLCLFTADPTQSGSFTNEVSGGSYARVPLSTLMGTATGGTMVNTSDIETATATAAWGTITHVGIADDDTGGNLLAYVALSSANSKTVNIGGKFTIKAGNMTLRGIL